MGAELRQILFIEDDPDIQVIGQLALGAIGGFDVIVCSGGLEAITRAALCSPDLILLDVMMPGLDGPSTLLRLRERPYFQSIPAIFLTAKVMPDQLAGLEALSAGVIKKPFDPLTLADEVRALWVALNR